ncbi:MAG TPA: 7-carboxy-7-deazaguanine synthase QueE [Chitinophagaceae bacterium]|nr:7-carboxy-7-deazaguanine synthase QueE [Chitinophagaceae bacterium]
MKSEISNPKSEIGSTLPVMEHFYTLQGEGFHQGRAAYFIRLGGCDIGCVWCDVKESWDAAKYPKYEAAKLITEAKKTPAEIVVITGGEPLMYDLIQFTETLQQAGYKTHLETSGAYRLTGTWDWICVSPKKFRAPLHDILPKADELKVVIFNKSDFDWAEEHAAKVSKHCKLFLQPEWDKAAQITPLIIDYIKAHPKWELSLQIHKYINVP